MPIRVLAEDVAAQIAAGEVVERPVSVVKELVENGIDAGAGDIRIEVQAGGRRLIRVVDDGWGIPADEVELAFARHSTSKLATAADLDRITTLGFRGEALASIAAVSRVTLVTRTQSELVGTLLRLEGGRVVARETSGRPQGTAVTVEELFFNVPARRKFLRSESTERRHINGWVTRYGMAYPSLRFTLVHDGRLAFQSTGNGRLRDVLIAVYGLEVGAAALEIIPDDPHPTSNIRHPASSIQVSGFVSPPALHRANRTYITLFVNGRWIQDTRLTYAVVQAYHTLLPTGRYPLAVLMIRLPPEEVDVNVHPAKAEVRFRDGDAVFRAVQRAVRRTLVERAPVPQMVRPVTAWPVPGEAARRERLARLEVRPASEQLRFQVPRPMPPPPTIPSTAEGETAPPEVGPATPGLPVLRVVGQLGATYVVAEGPEGLYLIDQHAAHERVLYEQLMAQRQGAGVASQGLLEPTAVELSPEAASLVEEHAGLLAKLGFALEPFGGATFLVRALPAILAGADPAEVLEDVAAVLGAGEAPLAGELEQRIGSQVCKRAAVKAGQVLSHEEMVGLVQALERCASPHACPHGRPTMIHLSAEQLAREFGR